MELNASFPLQIQRETEKKNTKSTNNNTEKLLTSLSSIQIGHKHKHTSTQKCCPNLLFIETNNKVH